MSSQIEVTIINTIDNIDNIDNINKINKINNNNVDRLEDRRDEVEINNKTVDLPININIYRYKFTQEFMDELNKFSKIHQYDDRHSFKESWKFWVEQNSEIVENEINRLSGLGYDGDILDKMFKSARYYFRKKDITPQEPKERRKYISVHKDVLDAMDSHILSSMNFPDYKPSDGFANFCNTNIEELKSESSRLLENNLNSQEIMDKIKKTYKNRYFMAITK